MSGVFISYARADQPLARRLTLALRSLGIDVWWDEDMPSVDWQRELERRIQELAVVVVLWTPHSTDSDPVRDEARLGKDTRKLINLLWNLQKPPFPYDAINGLPLKGWTGMEPHTSWTRLVGSIEDMLVRAGTCAPGEIREALTRQEAELQTRQAAIAKAEKALAKAERAHEGLASQLASATARAAEADAQIANLRQMAASKAVMNAALDERDEEKAALAALREQDAQMLAQIRQDGPALATMKRDFGRWLGANGAEPDAGAEAAGVAADDVAEAAVVSLPPPPPPPPVTKPAKPKLVEVAAEPVVAPPPSPPKQQEPAPEPESAPEPEPEPEPEPTIVETPTIEAEAKSRVPMMAGGAVAALLVAGLLYMVSRPDTPEPGGSVENTVAASGRAAWLAGHWGIEGDCSAAIRITTNADGIALSDGASGTESPETIQGYKAGSILTDQARYTLRSKAGTEASYDASVEMAPTDPNLSKVRLKRCPTP